MWLERVPEEQEQLPKTSLRYIKPLVLRDLSYNYADTNGQLSQDPGNLSFTLEAKNGMCETTKIECVSHGFPRFREGQCRTPGYSFSLSDPMEPWRHELTITHRSADT